MARGKFRREKKIEERVNQRAIEELQVANIPLKLLLGATTGWPDRLYLLGYGAVLFIEFKDPDEGGVSPKQALIIGMLEGLGYDVQIHDNEDAAFCAIEAAKMVAAQLPKEGKAVSARQRRRNRPS